MKNNKTCCDNNKTVNRTLIECLQFYDTFSHPNRYFRQSNFLKVKMKNYVNLNYKKITFLT